MVMSYKELLLVATGLLCLFQYVEGQSQVGDPFQLYVECDDCNEDHIRRNLPFVSFVRDPQLADLYILVTERDTGSGGNLYLMEFMGRKKWEGQQFEIQSITEQSDTDDIVRTKLLQSIRAGLIPFLANTYGAMNLELDLAEIKPVEETSITSDPWKNWIFSIELAGGFDLEERKKEFEYKGEFAIRKITEWWKFESGLEVNYEEKRFLDDGEYLISTQDDKGLEASWVKSITDHLSAGVRGEMFSSTFTNTKMGSSFSPAIEYNFYPWDQSHIREFTVAYDVSFHSFAYFEETIYLKNQETLLSEAISLNLRYIRPWGEFRAEVEASHYLNDFSKNRLESELQLGYRISSGLLLTAEVEIQRIHDQLYLEKGEATLEDLLLEQRRVKTNYDISGSVGVRFTFGSIYNDVVNPRL